ncbi:MAG: hypothetical protein JST79_22105 [Acidobacteria bacterium]|nr:hypothetical protein [Acidobacteriota bacterium]
MEKCKVLRLMGGIVGATVLSGLVACGGGSSNGGGGTPPPPPPPNVTIAVAPKSYNLVSPQTLQFTATLTGDTQHQGATWKVDGVAGGNSTVGTISASGLYTPPAGGGGAHTIVATSVADTTKSDSAGINVTDLAGVFTYHNNLARDGTNTQEYILNTSNVKSGTFGKLFSCAVDGAVYAQPLWVPNVTINGGLHNVVVVATQHDSVYAFDADASPCATLWHASLLDTAHGATTGETSVSWTDVGNGYKDIYPEIGITGTPVIDPSSHTLYVVSKSEKTTSNFYQRLHALDIATGNEKLSGPVSITASVTGTGDGNVGGTIAFDPRYHLQRPGLALVNGVVYISWASHEDKTPYHGWVIGYDASTLQQLSVFNTTPNDGLGGIWMGGGAPAADSAGNLYLATGNGGFDADSNLSLNDVGDSILKLNPSGLVRADYFTPYNQGALESNDGDLGAGGVLLLPDQTGPVPHLLVEGGKQGLIYVLDRDNMGQYNSIDNSQIVQTVTLSSGVFSTPAFWQNTLYLTAIRDYLRALPFNPTTGQFSATPNSTSAYKFPFPPPTPSISSQGASNGIVWITDSSLYGPPKTAPAAPAVLYAYDATNLGNMLWNSSLNASDTAGNSVKFTVPTIANGKVYIGTATEVDVYGLLP